MRSALTWVCLGLLASTATATLSQEAMDELELELKAKGEDYGLFVDPAENELFDLLQNDGQGDDDDAAFQPPAQDEDPPARYPGDSSEVIESIDEIESITPIKSIQEVKSIKPVKSIEEIKSITPIKSIQEVKSIKKVKSILPVPDDIAQKFIADHNLVPVDGEAPYYKEYENPPTTGGGSPTSLRNRLEAVIDTLNALLQEVDTNMCAQVPDYEPLPDPEPGPTWKHSATWNPDTKLPFDKDDIKSIDEITSMQEVKSMLPVKSIEEVKSITPIKSIQEVTGLYELTDEQADMLRRLNAKWSKGGARRNRRRRRF